MQNIKNIKNIKITVDAYGKYYVLETYRGEYRSLMALICDQIGIDNFGDCKGMVRCGTCLISIVNSAGGNMSPERNEILLLNKLEGVDKNSRLACQVLIDESINGIQVYIPDIF